MFEVVVVDNASSDATPGVAQSFQDRIALRYVREERIGLCVARNTGWRAASGRYVVFFDDDAIARPGWLRAIKATFERAGPSAGVIGGRVDPIWEASRPSWLADEIAGSLTIVHWGDDEKVIRDIRLEWLVGANMALPKHLLADIGGFHPWLDRVGNNLLSSGDVFLQKEVMRRGYECLYVPAIAVEHLVPASRLTQKMVLETIFLAGRIRCGDAIDRAGAVASSARVAGGEPDAADAALAGPSRRLSPSGLTALRHSRRSALR